jgi:hypothetical protein
MRILLILVFILTCAAEDLALTPNEKLAALVFTDVQFIDVTTLIEVEMPSDNPNEDDHVITAAATYPSLTISKTHIKDLLATIAKAENYRFDDTALCFEPGMRIRVHEKQRITTLRVCLECAKMSVSTVGKKSFIIDFSPAGLMAYKAAYVDFIVMKKGQKRD